MKRILPLFLLFFSGFSFGQQPIAEICLATVDTGLTYNVVVWERASQMSVYPIDSMKIYRRTGVGTDVLVGAVHYDSLSEFHDLSADPNLQAYTYRIAAVDSTGTEGPKSLPHRTIHFSVLDNGNGNLHLVWTPYIGHQVDLYDCWRDSMGGVTINNLIFTTPSSNDTAWWDNNTPADWTNLWYKVDVQWTLSCESTRANHNTTRSNRTQPISGEVGVGEKTLQAFNIYPNPSNGLITFEYSSLAWRNTTVKVFNVDGKEVYAEPVVRVRGQYRNQVDLSHLPAGVYVMRIENGIDRLSKRLIIAE